MKFTFYGLWEDELPKLKELSETYGFAYEGTEEVLTEKNAVLSAGSDGVSILGKITVGAALAGAFGTRDPVFVHAQYRL